MLCLYCKSLPAGLDRTYGHDNCTTILWSVFGFTIICNRSRLAYAIA